jgi:K(+)-stimulated pyrophosphate-energized sodium pump
MIIEQSAIIMSILALVYAGYLTSNILKKKEGTDKMKDISLAIHQGAKSFMFREFKSISIFSVVVVLVLWLILKEPFVALTFVIGVITSALAGYVAMWVATKSNARVANLAQDSFPQALKTAFSGGAVMGFTVVGFGLLGLVILYLIFPNVDVLLGYAFGASCVALFLRVGGGIFTKSADVGADLVGKVEAGIPEDDPRNPGTIADNVGDNVGDIAGMGSDLFESYVSAIIAAMFLGVLLGPKQVTLPLLLAGIGIIVSIIGSLFVSSGGASDNYDEQTKNAKNALNRGVIVSNVLMIVASYVAIMKTLGDVNIFWALVTGLMSGFLIGKVTEYYTSGKTVKRIAKASSNPATNIIEGLATGMTSTVLPVIIVALATLLAFKFSGLYGIAIASVGMLVTLGMILSIDGYGPISDNAAGIAEMAGLGEEVRGRAEALDAVGNTTAAIGKGFAISSAALAALAWLAAFFAHAKLDVISITEPTVMAGLFIGGMLPFLFSALTMRAVGKGAGFVVDEVRRQFREIKGLMEGTAKADHERCIDIVTRASLREMLLPGIIVLTVPVMVGFLIGLEALGGLLAGSLVSGFLLAVMMSNSGGAWDNAKKYIESGEFGGKGSQHHKSAVIGDTIGDPFKDTSGPSINILIKLVGKVALIFVPLFMAIGIKLF